MMNREEKLWEHLEEIRKQGYSPKELERYYAYYMGDFSGKEFKELQNACNVIKQIIDTKATLALDTMMAATVVPAPSEMSHIELLQDMQDVADFLDEALKSAFKRNEFDSIKQQVVLDGLVYGIGITECVWDADKDGVGDVQISVIDPRKVKVEKLS